MNLLRLAADVTGRILNTLWPEPFHLAADDLWADTGGHHHEIALLKEIAGHTAAVRALLEDTRNLLNHQVSAAGIPLPVAERPAPTLGGAGHPDNADLDDLLLYECPNPSCPCHGGFCNAQKVGSGWPGCAKPYGHSGQHGYAGLFWDNDTTK
jgi:hypothetical protein